MRPSFPAPDNAQVIDAVLEALAANGRVEVLYMQAFEAGMGDAQLDRLAALLTAAPQLWAVHLGENACVSRRAWERFAIALPATSVAHLYVSERHLAGTDLKERMEAAAAANAARAPRRDPEVLAHVAGLWTTPPQPPPPAPSHGRSAGALPVHSADSGGGGCLTDEEEDSAASGGAEVEDDPELLPFGSLPQLHVGLGVAPSGLGPPISSPISRRQPGSLAAAGRARGRLPLPNARPVAGASRASSLLPLPPPPKPLGPDGQPIDTTASMRLRSGSSVATVPPAPPHRPAPGPRVPPPPPAPKPAPLPTVTSGRMPRRAAARRAAQAMGTDFVTYSDVSAREPPTAPEPPPAKRLRAAAARAVVVAPPAPAPANGDDVDFVPPSRSVTPSARRSHLAANAAARATRAPVAAVAATSSGGQGVSAALACRPELKGKPSFAELVEGGFMQPGPYRFAVGNADVMVTLEADGEDVPAGAVGEVQGITAGALRAHAPCRPDHRRRGHCLRRPPLPRHLKVCTGGAARAQPSTPVLRRLEGGGLEW